MPSSYVNVRLCFFVQRNNAALGKRTHGGRTHLAVDFAKGSRAAPTGSRPLSPRSRKLEKSCDPLHSVAKWVQDEVA
jgi:hypothetical protein